MLPFECLVRPILPHAFLAKEAHPTLFLLLKRGSYFHLPSQHKDSIMKCPSFFGLAGFGRTLLVAVPFTLLVGGCYTQYASVSEDGLDQSSPSSHQAPSRQATAESAVRNPSEKTTAGEGPVEYAREYRRENRYDLSSESGRTEATSRGSRPSPRSSQISPAERTPRGSLERGSEADRVIVEHRYFGEPLYDDPSYDLPYSSPYSFYHGPYYHGSYYHPSSLPSAAVFPYRSRSVGYAVPTSKVYSHGFISISILARLVPGDVQVSVGHRSFSPAFHQRRFPSSGFRHPFHGSLYRNGHFSFYRNRSFIDARPGNAYYGDVYHGDVFYGDVYFGDVYSGIGYNGISDSFGSSSSRRPRSSSISSQNRTNVPRRSSVGRSSTRSDSGARKSSAETRTQRRSLAGRIGRKSKGTVDERSRRSSRSVGEKARAESRSSRTTAANRHSRASQPDRKKSFSARGRIGRRESPNETPEASSNSERTRGSKRIRGQRGRIGSQGQMTRTAGNSPRRNVSRGDSERWRGGNTGHADRSGRIGRPNQASRTKNRDLVDRRQDEVSRSRQEPSLEREVSQAGSRSLSRTRFRDERWSRGKSRPRGKSQSVDQRQAGSPASSNSGGRIGGSSRIGVSRGAEERFRRSRGASYKSSGNREPASSRRLSSPRHSSSLPTRSNRQGRRHAQATQIEKDVETRTDRPDSQDRRMRQLQTRQNRSAQPSRSKVHQGNFSNNRTGRSSTATDRESRANRLSQRRSGATTGNGTTKRRGARHRTDSQGRVQSSPNREKADRSSRRSARESNSRPGTSQSRRSSGRGESAGDNSDEDSDG